MWYKFVVFHLILFSSIKVWRYWTHIYFWKYVIFRIPYSMKSGIHPFFLFFNQLEKEFPCHASVFVSVWKFASFAVGKIQCLLTLSGCLLTMTTEWCSYRASVAFLSARTATNSYGYLSVQLNCPLREPELSVQLFATTSSALVGLARHGYCLVAWGISECRVCDW